MKKECKHIHFIGICGTAMGSLAAMLKSLGYHVTGSDEHVYPPMSTFLENQAIQIFNGFSEEHLKPAPDLVIVGNAISRGNSEVEIVLEKKISYTSLPVALKDFFIQGKHSIVITGTHGKTTTSSLIAWLLEKAGKKPGFLIGGIPQNFNQGFKVDAGNIFVVEGDEYDTAFFDKAAKFFHYLPDVAVVNNIEYDHADIYDNIDQIKLAFRRFVNLIPRNGLLVAGIDDDNVKELVPRAFCPVQTFGFHTDATWTPRQIAFHDSSTTFAVFREHKFFGDFSMPLSGNHNILNALAAIAVAHFEGLSLEQMQTALASFQNVKKRLEIRAIIDDIIIYDDFAHHPTEVKMTIEGLRARFPARKIWAVFEPRTATTKRACMLESYSKAFDAADTTIIAPLHLPHKVKAEDRLSVEDLVDHIKHRKKEVYYIESTVQIVNYIANHIQPDDIVLIMSNGSFGGIHDLLIGKLEKKENGKKK